MSFIYRASNWATCRMPVKLVRSRLDRPVASVTFDDFPKSAWTVGGPILAKHGAVGTYYAAGGFCGRTVDGIGYFDEADLRALHAAGHEVGCHTFSHDHGPKLSSAQLQAEAERNSAFVREVLGDVRLSTFAYPYGDVSPRTKLLFSGLFPACRGIRAGVNSGLLDLAQLKVVPLEIRSWSAAETEALIDEGLAANGWIVFFTHDVADDPSPYGCTPAMLEHGLARVRAAGVDVVAMKHALARAAGPSAP